MNDGIEVSLTGNGGATAIVIKDIIKYKHVPLPILHILETCAITTNIQGQ